MTVRLNGKEYVTVSERVEAALSAETSYQMVSAETFSLMERWFYRVTLLVGERQYIGTAEIKFNASASSADGKNPIECAETSAVGRALGFAGFGVVDGIASADEMARSEPRQPQRPAQATAPQAAATPTADDGQTGANGKQLAAIGHLCESLGKPVPAVRSYGHAKALITQLTNEWQAQRRKQQAS